MEDLPSPSKRTSWHRKSFLCQDVCDSRNPDKQEKKCHGKHEIILASIFFQNVRLVEKKCSAHQFHENQRAIIDDQQFSKDIRHTTPPFIEIMVLLACFIVMKTLLTRILISSRLRGSPLLDFEKSETPERELEEKKQFIADLSKGNAVLKKRLGQVNGPHARTTFSFTCSFTIRATCGKTCARSQIPWP